MQKITGQGGGEKEYKNYVDKSSITKHTSLRSLATVSKDERRTIYLMNLQYDD